MWKRNLRKWDRRKTKKFSIGRIFFVPLGSGELYFLRLLLNTTKGPTCYEDLRILDVITHPTFRDACYALGLLDDDKEYVDSIEEASYWRMSFYLRQLQCCRNLILCVDQNLLRMKHGNYYQMTSFMKKDNFLEIEVCIGIFFFHIILILYSH